MDPAVLVATVLVPVVLVVFAVGGLGARQRRAFEDALRRVGETRGLTLRPSGWTKGASLRGETEGVDVCVDSYVVSTGKSSTTYTRVRTRHPHLPPILRIVPEGVLNTVGVALGLDQDVRVGDPELDSVVTIRGEYEDTVVARMAPETRRAVAAAVTAGGRFEDGAWTLLHHGLVTDPDELGRLLRLAVGASRALIDSDPSEEALRRRAVEDPVRSVRRRALGIAIAHSAVPDEWLASVAAGDDPEAVVRASRARGERGRERLWWAVDQRRSPWDREAALALAALAPDERRPDLEAILLRALEQTADVEVIEALGRVASVRAVAPLQAVIGPLGVGAVSSRAKEAVRAIQGRAHGEAGGLAIAEASGGELAEAGESRLGRLSQARVPER